MKCPNCKKEVKWIFTNHNSNYPIDDSRSKICKFCATPEQADKSKSLKELNYERQT